MNGINEADIPYFDKESGSLEQIAEILNTHCSDSFGKQPKVYRGVDDISAPDFGYFSATMTHRRPAHFRWDYYKAIFSKLESWKNFPARQRSITCLTDRRKASQYAHGGSLYIVYPVNGARIGICPASDFHLSFSESLPDKIQDMLFKLPSIGERSFFKRAEEAGIDLEKEFGAEYNGFTIVQTQYWDHIPRGREVWTDSPCYLLNETLFKEMRIKGLVYE